MALVPIDCHRSLPAGVCASARLRRVSRRWAVSHVRCRVPAWRPGNFHLLAQMKVTKAKGLNTDLGGMLGCKLKRSLGHRRTSDCFLADPSSRCDFIGRKSALATRQWPDGLFCRSARYEVFVRERSRFEAQEIQRREAASQSTRKRCELLSETKPGVLSRQTFAQIGIQALFFGDFLLSQQKKVTRPPGRDPAPHMRNRPPGRNPATLGISRDPVRC